ncbi:MAG: hypothetical protein RIS94_3727 [Pseudomonadota bacterium]
MVIPAPAATSSGEISAPPTVRRTLGSRWTTRTPAASSAARTKRASSSLVSCVTIINTLGIITLDFVLDCSVMVVLSVPRLVRQTT